MTITRPPCDRCDERPAVRYGRAQARTTNGIRWMDVGLCERCASQAAAPTISRSSLGVDAHGIAPKR